MSSLTDLVEKSTVIERIFIHGNTAGVPGDFCQKATQQRCRVEVFLGTNHVIDGDDGENDVTGQEEGIGAEGGSVFEDGVFNRT